mmetsp:Transcript_16891/g.36832  ORF Transcript_16891/g.36832 Transcript_16891/m.36832 type:complete len:82 (-) Transcript_16891:14-259(-)
MIAMRISLLENMIQQACSTLAAGSMALTTTKKCRQKSSAKSISFAHSIAAISFVGGNMLLDQHSQEATMSSVKSHAAGRSE